MKKYAFKMNEKNDRKEGKVSEPLETGELASCMNIINGQYLSSLPSVDTVISQILAEVRINSLKGFGERIEGKIFEKTGDNYWHTEYRTEIINEKGSETVRIVRHEIAAAMCSFTAFDIFIGGKRIDIFESIWDELISHFHPVD